MTSLPTTKADILIVDDTPDNIRFLSAILTGQGYKVRGVTRGKTALMGVQAHLPDLILLDAVMPGIDGFELCKTLKANPVTQDIPAIFISALSEVTNKVRGLNAGAVDYITKPFQIPEVLARVETQLTLHRLQQQLRETLDRECALNQRIEQLAVYQERHRLAREIHDSLGHSLVALNIQIDAALTLWHDRPERAYTFVKDAKRLGTEALQAVRQSVTQMRSDSVQAQLLETAIAKLVEEFQTNTGILPDCEIDLALPLSNELSTAVYRILQEGLTNICKYAEPTTVRIQIGGKDRSLQIVLTDNGNGFELETAKTGFGLIGMKERAENFGGSLEILTAPQAGCQIVALLPLQ
ncbi:ATP-binding response regulator [Chamaesiphon polymorphus]|uniref:histidine kinase n=1 Tax=Chamaesiphon polymorphus CCALA 037 TaxID=2107692 RepID=A0A2T1F5S9_9CYAN|nr:response regulator [Chamaesiphon polymorphus]PSB40278.1 histidine kinase [Chamaesiphon polymorphus CCALA 037]